ncbi:MAG: alpha,alpha-trehalase TreA [Cyclobacteriaceae bacterium]|nr:alpha,alpha-trehalase TreA [Cyclobacteriaceae bacterium]
MKDLQIHELGPLFEEVQLKNILGDGKTFPDCIPKKPLDSIRSEYSREKAIPGFDLQRFFNENFSLPKTFSTGYVSDTSRSAEEHIKALWEVLTRTPDEEAGSLLPLPHSYIVPGGRFREIYYWDSYFTMLGLELSDRGDLIQNMVDNFSYLINTVGYIPNGNRTYFLGRSQPPFFSLMVNLLSKQSSTTRKETLVKYLFVLEKEHQFWMKGAELLTPSQTSQRRVVRMNDGNILNRYWDENDTPRPEAYKEDLELSHSSKQKPEELFRHLRAAAESGWDFSSRWFRDEKSFATIHTTEIIPVDLNCLLLHLEETLEEAWNLSGNDVKSGEYKQRHEKRKTAIIQYCWNEEKKFFFDFDFVSQHQKTQYTLAAAFPLFFKVATPLQAKAIAEILQTKFLKPGGLITTLKSSGQQWDAPNGWAPLQWIAFKGLINYNLLNIAQQLKSNWINANRKVYQKTGKMTEKYDVSSDHAEASGGEYPNQDGFGWTNGVFLAMVNS